MQMRALSLLVLLLVLCVRGPAQQAEPPASVLGEKDVERLITITASPSSAADMRISAMKRLAALNEPRLLPILIPALADRLPEVRENAARVLAIIGDHDASLAVATLVTDKTPEVRLAAVTTLGWLHNPETLPDLLTALTDTDSVVQSAAVRALARFADAKATEALRKLARDATNPARCQALLTLAWHGDKSILPLLLERVKAPDFHDQQLAQALAELGTPEALDALAGLGSHQDITIRREACVGLSRIGTPQAIEKLLALIRAQAPQVRSPQEMTAVWEPALYTLPIPASTPPLQSMLSDQYNVLPAMALPGVAARLLAWQYEGPTAELRKLYAEGSPRISWKIHWLGQRQPADLDELLRPGNYDLQVGVVSPMRAWRDSEQLDGLLGPPPPPIAFYVPAQTRGSWFTGAGLTKSIQDQLAATPKIWDPRMGFLCYAHDPAVETMLCRKLEFDPEDRFGISWCGRMLGILGDPDAIPLLLKAVHNQERQPRMGAMEGLCGCADGRDPASFQLLRQALSDPDAEVRKAVVAALGCSREAAAVPDLLNLLQTDQVPEVREYCALALGLIGDTRAVDPLCAALKDPVEWARSAAAWALGEIGDPRAIGPLTTALQQDRNVRFQVRLARSLYLLGQHDAALTLADLTACDDAMTQGIAFEALLECNEPRIAGTLLVHMMKQKDFLAVEALGRQQGELAVRFLLPLLSEREHTQNTWQDTRCRIAAAHALGRIGEGKHGDWLQETHETLAAAAATDPEPDVRAAAALALARLHHPHAVELLDGVMKYYLPERNAAIRALWTLPEPRATELLAAALQDDDTLGRVLAAHGLMLRGDPRGAAALRELVTTVSEPVALQLAVRYATELHDAALAPTLCRLARAGCADAKINLPVEATLSLAQNPAPEAAATLIDLLASPSSRIREAAALALRGSTDPNALPALHARLAKEEAGKVRAAIEKAIANGVNRGQP